MVLSFLEEIAPPCPFNDVCYYDFGEGDMLLAQFNPTLFDDKERTLELC